MSNTIVNPTIGVQPGSDEAVFIARGGNVCAGYTYPLCLGQNSLISDDGVTVIVMPGGEGSVWANIAGGVGSVTADLYAGVHVVALESFLDGARGLCKLRGICNAYVQNNADASVNIGDVLSVIAGSSPASNLNAATPGSNASPRKIVGFSLAANASSASVHPSTPALLRVEFDGWHGFGAGQV